MFKIFSGYSNLIAVISERSDGTMKLTGDSLGEKKIIENRERFLRKFGINDKLTVKAALVHGNNVRIVSKREAGKVIEKTDGLITADKSLFLTITVADCLPIFLYDPGKRVVGLIHAGWRNLAGNILRKAIEKMAKNFGTLPKNILAGIGPGISQCHFEIRDDLLKKFPKKIKVSEKEGKLFLDLKKIAKTQLINFGVQEENIEVNQECTFCLKDKYFSFRRDVSPYLSIGSGGKPKTPSTTKNWCEGKPQTMIAVIGKINI